MSVFASFLETLASEETRRAYEADVRRFFRTDRLSRADIESVSSDEIRNFVGSMAERGVSESTQRRRIAALRRFFDWTVEQGMRSHNPARAKSVRPVEGTTDDDSRRILSRDEIRQIVKVAASDSTAGPRNQALILTIVYGALRRSEVAALRVEDVRPLGRYWVLDIARSDSRSGGYVRIPDLVVEVIERMKRKYDVTEGPLWRSLSNRNRGRPMTPDAIYKVVRSVGEEAEIEGVTIDMLRRSGLRLAIQGGASLSRVQAHGRFATAASAAGLHQDEDRPSTLKDSAVDFVDLDIADLLRTSSDDASSS